MSSGKANQAFVVCVLVLASGMAVKAQQGDGEVRRGSAEDPIKQAVEIKVEGTGRDFAPPVDPSNQQNPAKRELLQTGLDPQTVAPSSQEYTACEQNQFRVKLKDGSIVSLKYIPPTPIDMQQILSDKVGTERDAIIASYGDTAHPWMQQLDLQIRESLANGSPDSIELAQRLIEVYNKKAVGLFSDVFVYTGLPRAWVFESSSRPPSMPIPGGMKPAPSPIPGVVPSPSPSP